MTTDTTDTTTTTTTTTPTLASMLLDDAVQPSTPTPAPKRLLGDHLRPDIAHVRRSYARLAITGEAPSFVEGVQGALAASEQGVRRDRQEVVLQDCSVARSAEGIILRTPQGDHPLRRHAFDQLARHAQAPAAYLREVATPIALDAINWGLREHAQDLQPRTLRLEGEEVRAVLSARYSPLDDRSAYRVVYRALRSAGRLDEAQCEAWSTGKVSSLRVSFGEVKIAGARNDGHALVTNGGEGFGLRAGITVRNSELGTGSLRVISSLWRHWCANGATIERLAGASWSRRHTGDWEVQVEDLAEALAQIIATSERVLRDAVPGAAKDVFDVDALQARLQRIKLTRAERRLVARETLAEALGQYDGAIAARTFETPADASRNEADAVFEALQRRRLEDEADDVLAVLQRAPEVNGWNLTNGVTAAARLAAEGGNTERAAELEALGGELLAAYLN